MLCRGGSQPRAARGAMGADVQPVQAGMAAAVASVVGATVADDQPLMEAGLDSLGEQLPAAHSIPILYPDMLL